MILLLILLIRSLEAFLCFQKLIACWLLVSACQCLTMPTDSDLEASWRDPYRDWGQPEGDRCQGDQQVPCGQRFTTNAPRAPLWKATGGGRGGLNTDDVSFHVHRLKVRAAGGRRKEGTDAIFCLFPYYLKNWKTGKKSQNFMHYLHHFKQRLNTSNGDLQKTERLFLIRAGM